MLQPKVEVWMPFRNTFEVPSFVQSILEDRVVQSAARILLKDRVSPICIRVFRIPVAPRVDLAQAWGTLRVPIMEGFAPLHETHLPHALTRALGGVRCLWEVVPVLKSEFSPQLVFGLQLDALYRTLPPTDSKFPFFLVGLSPLRPPRRSYSVRFAAAEAAVVAPASCKAMVQRAGAEKR